MGFRIRRLAWWGLWAVLALLLALQLFRPERANPPAEPDASILARAQVPPGVEDVLRRACFDCHSHATRWPWYSQVAPVSWWLADHVRTARGAMNLSAWPDPGSSSGRFAAAFNLEAICREVREGEMPLASYRLLHPGARLTGEEIDLLCAWAEEEAGRLTGG